MPTVYTSADLSRLATTLRTLLSPLDHDSLDAWRGAVNGSVGALIGADKAVAILPHLAIGSAGLESSALSSYFEHYSRLDVGLERREALGLEVWSVLQLLDASAHHRTEIWNDWKAPHGLLGATGIQVTVDGHAAGLFFYDATETADLEERQLELLALVKTAFVAGVRTYISLSEHRANLEQVVDGASTALALFTADGRLLYVNRALRHILDTEPRADDLRDAVALGSRDLARALGSPRKASSHLVPGPGSFEVRLAGQYRVTLSHVAAAGPQGVAVIASVDVIALPLPTRDVLRRRFGLTFKEAAVALMVADGMQNRQIASALSISPHTARHHTERIFLKLGIRRREEVLARLTAGEAARSARR